MKQLFPRRPLQAIRKSKGFTLIELAIVAVFLGLLAIFAVSQFSGSATDATRANAMKDAANKLAQSWSMATTACGISTSVGVSPLAATPSAANNLSVLLGTLPVNPTYASCYGSAGVKPLAGLTQGVQGSETLFTYPVTLSSPAGTSPRSLNVTFSNVPDSIAIQLYNKYSSAAGAAAATTMPAAADTTDPLLQFTALSGGVRNVTLQMSI